MPPRSSRPEQIKLPPVTLENVRIIYKNFSGKETLYNAAGKRNFNILLDYEMANRLAADGWAVKMLEPRPEDEGDLPKGKLLVKINYSPNSRPPLVVMIKHNGRVNLDESTISALDHMWFENVDVTISPFTWDPGTGPKVYAYLRDIYVTIKEDYLAKKYSGIPEIGVDEASLPDDVELD